MSLLPHLAVLFLASTIGTSTVAETYKCVGAHGRTVYTDHPCSTGKSSWQAPKAVVVPSLPAADVSTLPTNAQGQPVLNRIGDAELVLEEQDRPGPINVLAACGALVTRCVSPGERDLDACFLSAPRCRSLQPWEDKPFTHCCPEACWLAYKTNRQANMPPLKAFDRAMYGGAEGGCLAPQR
jgi:hypothetical protein